jgi:serine/threonine-protein kinase
MTRERWDRVKEVFQAAADRDPSERASYLDSTCAGEPEIRREVESLLAHHDATGEFLTPPPPGAAAPSSEAEPELSPGTSLGPYAIVELLGAGGMGQVYRARDTRLGREVAIKVLPQGLQNDPDALARFTREMKALAALSHPSITAIYDVGEHEGIRFAVMELLEGETLRARLRRGTFPAVEAVSLSSAIAEGLAAAHGKGIVHRDLKPENVFLTSDGRVKILDFGLAGTAARNRAVSDESTEALLTVPGMIMGTLGYMAPEQVRGEPTDARTDIFALGCLVYEALRGERPFARSTMAESLAAVLRDDPISVARGGLGSPTLQAVVARCLEKDPARRFQSAQEVAAALRAAAQAGGSAWTHPRPWVVATLGLALAAGTLFGLRQCSRRAKVAQGPPVLAVLPLQNLSRDPNQEYFADGMTEALIADLAKIGGLRVISRTSVMRYKSTGKAVPEIARELKASAVLEGAVLLSGERVRVTAQLIDARTDEHLWAESYERGLGDVLDLQRDIAQEVARRIRVTITAQEGARLGARRAINPEAYRAYLEGRYQLAKRTPVEARKALASFQAAAGLDPGYALAYVGVADCYDLLGNRGWLRPDEAFPRARAAALNALDLDATLGEAHNSLGQILMNSWEWQGAEREHRQAIELSPSYAEAHERLALLLAYLGRDAEAMAAVTRALELDPLSRQITANVGVLHYYGRRYDTAIEALERAVELEATNAAAHLGLAWVYATRGGHAKAIEAAESYRTLAGPVPDALSALGYAYAMAGKRSEAQREVAELTQRARTEYVAAYEVALVHVGLGEVEQALRWLETGFREHDPKLRRLKVDPKFDPLHREPRFQELLRRIGLGPRSDDAGALNSRPSAAPE